MRTHIDRHDRVAITVAAQSGLARAASILALAVACAGLGGCSARMFAHRVGLPVAAPPAEGAEATGATVDPMDARAQSSLHPGDPYWPYLMGQQLVAADSLTAAEAALKSSLARDASYAPALALLSKLYFDTGRHADGVALLEPVRARPDAFPNEAREILLAGLALHQDALGRSDLAGSAVPRSGGGDHDAALPARVYIALRGDRPDSAASLASEALQAAPKSAVNLNNFGITRLRAGDPKAAKRAFMSAIDREPDLPGPYYNLAILEKFYLFDDDAAAGFFRDYWRRSHDDPDSLRAVFTDPERRAEAREGR